MSGQIKKFAIALAIVFVAIQVIRPEPDNPPIDTQQTLDAQMPAARDFVRVIDRACNECHSSQSAAWPWYTQIAPLSWLMVRGVNEARKAVNFSEWGTYAPDKQRALLALSCKDASEGRMPMSAYTQMRPEAKLSPQDVETICAIARGNSVPAPMSK